MNLDDMLKQHQSWLDKVHKSLTSAKAEITPLSELHQQRIDALKERIANLEQQKGQAVERYDKAMAELNDELAHHAAQTPPPQEAKPAAAKKPPAKAAPAKAKPKKKK